MPIYEYRCQNCNEVFEVRQKFSDEPVATHSCGGQGQRLLSTPQFHFKGSGFYITDYGKGGSSKAGGSAKSESKTETKSESKPATPAPAASKSE